MAFDLYLLPRMAIGSDPVVARDWLESDSRQILDAPSDVDPAIEIRKKMLADLLLRMKPELKVFQLRREEIAKYENISVDEALRKYRYIELSSPGVQFEIFDRYIVARLYSKADLREIDAVLAALSVEGGFILFDPQSNDTIDLNEDFIASN